MTGICREMSGLTVARDIERGSRPIFRRRGQRKTAGAIHGDEADTPFILDLHGRRSLRCWVMLFAATTSQYPKTENRCEDNGVLHE